jgi:alanine racemase
MSVRAQASVDLVAISGNVAALKAAAPRSALCAVVKADAYGHGVVPVARAVLDAGADMLAVATAQEAAALRDGGIASRILVMGALSSDELGIATQAGGEVAVWGEGFLGKLPAGTKVHVKFDTGMGRLGTRDPDRARRVAERAAQSGELELVGLMTHFATADEPGDAFFGEQLGRFRDWLATTPPAPAHAANSAAVLRDAGSHFDMVRPGIALYGMDPFGRDPAEHGLTPALTLRSRVGAVKAIAVGESAGYGRRFIAAQRAVLATIPIGYGDGYRRGLTNNADVLIGGARYPLGDTFSMDNITVDLGSQTDVHIGDEVILIGRQGDEQIAAEELAERLQTINYEITCGLTARVPRDHRP